MKATRMTASLSAVAALVLTLAPVGSADAQQYHQNWVFGTTGFTTGLWNFDDPNNRYAGSKDLVCGQDGSVWIRDFEPGDIRGQTHFGLASSFGIPDMPDGDGGVMQFPAGDQHMAYQMFPGIEANGGGIYVNQYTLIFDVLYPQESNREWRPFFNTNDCNGNDGDVFVEDASPHGIGIDGQYDGTIRANRWHRVVLAFDLTTSSLDKYIDGELVGSQTLPGAGLDGRWSLYTASQGFPTLLFADNNSETALGYTSSVQIRDHTMTPADVAALGGVSAAGIPGGAGVTGQWDFEDPENGLAATTGNDLDWFDGSSCFSGDCEQDLNATTEFGTTTFFGIPDLPDGPANVMHWDAAQPCTGYLFPHGAEANPKGATRVNDYTIIADLYFTLDDWIGVPGNSTDYVSLYQSSLTNSEDAMSWFYKPWCAMGDDYEEPGQSCYDLTFGWFCEQEWRRIVVVVNGSNPNGTTVTYYAISENGFVDGPATCNEFEPVDGKRALRTDEEVGVDHLLFFSNNDFFYTARGIVNSIQVRDYTMGTFEVRQLGGPRAAGIPIGIPRVECPPECEPCDTNCDELVNSFDIEPFLALLFDPDSVPCCGERGVPGSAGDTNGDGEINSFDIEPFLDCLFGP